MSLKCPSCGEMCTIEQEICMMCYTSLNHIRTHYLEKTMNYEENNNGPAIMSLNNLEVDTALNRKFAKHIEGIAKNVCEDQIKENQLIRVYRSVFKGTPYSISGIITTFQVFNHWGDDLSSSNYCTDVIYYSKMSTGRVSENNNVTVLGKVSQSGSFMAESIYNNTTQSYTKGVVGDSISSKMMRVIMISIIILAFGILYFLSSNWTLIFSSIRSVLVTLIMIWILIKYIKFKFRRRYHRRRRR